MSGFFGNVFGKKDGDFEEYDFAPEVDFTPPDAVLRSNPQLNRQSSPAHHGPAQTRRSETTMQLQQEMMRNVEKAQGQSMREQPKPKVVAYDQMPTQVYDEPKPKKKWSLFGFGKKEPEFVEMPQEQPKADMILSNYEKELGDTREDMREMTKIFLAGMERMPPEELHKFKRTEEFDRLKVLLKKHNVIK